MSTNATTLAEIKINVHIFVNCTVGAVHGTESAGVALLAVNNRPEYPP